MSITTGSDLARVDVAGVIRDIDLGLLEGPFAPGDFILIHSGFALERMSPDEARDALDVFGESALPARDASARSLRP